eukprot:1283228-Amorphochlora_amoeboformis.AAC.1
MGELVTPEEMLGVATGLDVTGEETAGLFVESPPLVTGEWEVGERVWGDDVTGEAVSAKGETVVCELKVLGEQEDGHPL